MTDNFSIIKEDAKNFRINSLFETDSELKLWVSKHKNGVWQDYKAQKKGDFIKFVQYTLDFDSYGKAKMHLIKNYFFASKTIPSTYIAQKRSKEIKGLEIPEEFEKFVPSEHSEYAEYLKSRYVDYTNLKLFVDVKRKMVVFPVYMYDTLVYYVARSIRKNSYIRYLNATTEGQGFVYGLENIDSSSIVFIFEGIFDSLMVKNGIAILSANNVSEDLVENLLNKNPYKIYIVMDNDKAGKIAREKLIELLFKKHNQLYIFNWNKIQKKDISDVKEKSNGEIDIQKMIIENSELVDYKYKIKKIMETK